MSDYFICTIFSKGKCFFDSLNCMSSVCISGNVLINRLYTNFYSCASVCKHIWKMSFLTKIRSGFDGNSNTFLFTLFWELNSLFNVWGDMSTKCIVKIPNKIITILFIKRHKCSTHHNELDFINIMTNFFQLLYSISSLNIWIISGSNSTHWSWLISSIWLSWVLKVTIWSTWTIDTNISCCSNMWTSMRLTHYSYNCDSWSSSNRLSF